MTDSFEMNFRSSYCVLYSKILNSDTKTWAYVCPSAFFFGELTFEGGREVLSRVLLEGELQFVNARRNVEQRNFFADAIWVFPQNTITV